MKTRMIFALSAALSFAAGTASADNITWKGSAGDFDWFNVSNWSGTNLPTDGTFSPDGYRVLFEKTEYTETTGKVVFDSPVLLVSGDQQLDIRNGLEYPVVWSAEGENGLTATNKSFTIGGGSTTSPGYGYLIVDGGTYNVSNAMYVASEYNSTAYLYLSNAVFNVENAMRIGGSRTNTYGRVTVSGGELNVAQMLFVGGYNASTDCTDSYGYLDICGTGKVVVAEQDLRVGNHSGLKDAKITISESGELDAIKVALGVVDNSEGTLEMTGGTANLTEINVGSAKTARVISTSTAVKRTSRNSTSAMTPAGLAASLWTAGLSP